MEKPKQFFCVHGCHFLSVSENLLILVSKLLDVRTRAHCSLWGSIALYNKQKIIQNKN